MDKTTLSLFSYFPREVGRYRRVVYSVREFMRYVKLANGVSDVYTSLYDLNLHIDKVWMEVDAPSIEKALDSTKQVVKRIEDADAPYIVVFSGSKGFHIYVLLKVWRPPNAETGKAIIKNIQLQFTDGIKYVDPHGIGDIRRLVRVPNTVHPKTKKYCTYVSITDWNIDRVAHENEPFTPIRRIDIRELVDINYVPELTFTPDTLEFAQHSIPQDVYEFLKRIVRPCLVEYLATVRNPGHEIRTDLVAELMWLGYSEEEVLEIIRKLNWADFNERLTKYHIHKIFEKRLLPLSCSNLANYVKCNKCGWHYWYGGDIQ